MVFVSKRKMRGACSRGSEKQFWAPTADRCCRNRMCFRPLGSKSKYCQYLIRLQLSWNYSILRLVGTKDQKMQLVFQSCTQSASVCWIVAFIRQRWVGYDRTWYFLELHLILNYCQRQPDSDQPKLGIWKEIPNSTFWTLKDRDNATLWTDQMFYNSFDGELHFSII